MPADEESSNCANAERQLRLAILVRITQLHDEVARALEGAQPDVPFGPRSIQRLLHTVSVELNECYRQQASGTLSDSDRTHWMPVVASLRAILRRASAAISGRPEEKLKAALQRLQESMSKLTNYDTPA